MRGLTPCCAISIVGGAGKHWLTVDSTSINCIKYKRIVLKKSGKELEDDEIASYCDTAADFLSMSDVVIQMLIKEKALIELNEVKIDE
ncbi:hypothetical protein ABU178_14370 [Pantoea osteomyelitidis]|uniref:Uncharacterized protein n=1 Tax=Pantoea osteomyelitidis TaxID=3230026 RepID=A0ABW7Q1E4_9GAMM